MKRIDWLVLLLVWGVIGIVSYALWLYVQHGG